MQRSTRLKLDTICRILDFCRRYPDAASPAIALLVVRLERLSATVRALFDRRLVCQQQIAGAREERDHLADTLRPRLVGVVRLADTAAGSSHPRLKEVGRPRSPGVFLQFAQTVLDTAAARRTALVSYGMPPALLREITEELAACEAAHLRAIEVAQVHANAGAELDRAAAEALQTIRHLDALQALRFSADPLMLEEWKRTAAVAWPAGRRVEGAAVAGV